MAATTDRDSSSASGVDWDAAAKSPEFQELLRKRRSFVVPVLGFVFVWYFGFIALAGYAPDFMGESIYQGFTVGYLLALSQFVMTWFLGWLYLRQADRVFDPLARRAAERAVKPAGTAETVDRGEGDVLMVALLPLAEVNVEAIAIFSVVVSITLAITYWASKRTTDATSFWAAGRGITGVQNGFAIAGDYMSAASFLGIAGLIFLFGFDGFLYSVGFLVAFLIVLYLLAERMRNAGKFTMADVFSFRLNERPARTAAALGTLVVAAFYLIAQMVGAGALIEALVGINFNLAVLITGIFMLTYVVFGGMLATTWVQIIKAVLLMTATIVLSLIVLGKVGFNPVELFNRAEAQADDPSAYLTPGLRFTEPVDTISLGLGLLLGTAGLPHILMRFFTVPDAKAARTSVVWAVGLIGTFYVMTTFLGFGARALLGEEGTTGDVDEAGNLAAPLLAQSVGGGEGSIGGDAFLAIIAAVAFATILAVVAGLVISASGAVAHDVWSNVIRKGRDSEHEEVYVARIAAGIIGAIAITIAIAGGSDLNVSYMVGLAFAVAASANFPALLLALTWRRFNTTGAVTGVLTGVVSSVGLVLLGPDVSSNPLELFGVSLTQPAIVSVPLGFLGCYLGTVLSREESRAERGFNELQVRAETGLGAEIPIEGAGLRAQAPKRKPVTAARDEG